MKRLGTIGTAYNAGISHISAGFASQFPFKTLLVHNKPYAMFPERFPVHRITKDVNQDDIDWLLADIDILLIVETPYNWDVLRQAHEKGIKVYFEPMYEWLQKRPELKYVDLWVCPSIDTYDKVSGNKMLVPSEIPIDLTKFKSREVKKLKTLLHNSGHGGIGNRNSTPELIEAMKYITSDVQLIVNTQIGLNSTAPNVKVNYANFENYWDMYNEGDIWIMPAKYGYAFLGIQEACATGMPIMITDMAPFNKYLPKELLISAEIKEAPLFYGQKQPNAKIEPKLIAEAIDRVAALDLTEYSEKAYELAKACSWQTMKPIYEKIFS